MLRNIYDEDAEQQQKKTWDLPEKEKQQAALKEEKKRQRRLIRQRTYQMHHPSQEKTIGIYIYTYEKSYMGRGSVKTVTEVRIYLWQGLDRKRADAARSIILATLYAVRDC